MKHKYKSSKGFTLIETILVLSIIMLTISYKSLTLKQENINYLAKAESQQIKLVSDAANAYLVLKYSDIISFKDSALSCETTSSTCILPISTLKNNYLLRPNFSEKTIFNQPYIIQIKRQGTAPNYTISGIVLTKAFGTFDPNMTKQIMGKTLQNLGADGGIMKEKGKIIGLSAGWSASSSDFSVLSDKENYIGSAIGDLSGAYYVYLRRDGSLPMTGNLNMGGNDINNAKNITASNNITSNEINANQNINAGGNISADGNLTVNGNINNNGNIVSKDYIRSYNNIYAGKELFANNGYGDSISIGGDSIENDYEITMHSDKTLSIHMASNRTDLTTVHIVGGMTSSNIKSESTIYASGNIETSQYVKINSIVIAGNNCDSAGMLGRDQTGQILSCINNIWTPEQPVGIPQPWPSKTPPSGWFICDGSPFDMNKYPLLAKAYPSGYLPDLRGSFIRGLDLGKGIDKDRDILTSQKASVVTGTDDNWYDNDVGVLHGPSSSYSRDSININDYTQGGAGQTPKYWVHFGGGNGPGVNSSQGLNAGDINLTNNGSNGFYGGARPYNTSFLYIVRAL